MAMKKASKNNNADPTAELLRDLFILELAKVGVPQTEIRKVVGCDMNRVAKIAKVLRKAKNQAD